MIDPITELSNASRVYLARAGWRENRTIDPCPLEEANRNSGLFVGEQAIEFFKRFGNLKLTFPHFRVPSEDDSCHFDPSWASEIGISHLIKRYELAIRSRLTVIGGACSDHMILCMDEQGKVYGGFDELLVKFGDSGVDAINCFCEGREGIPINVKPSSISAPNEAIRLSGPPVDELRKATWTEEPTTGIRPPESDTKAQEFLREFAGSQFEYTICGTAKKDRCVITADIKLSSRYLQECESIIRQRLRPVGTLAASGLVLLMADDGRVFGGMPETSDFLLFIGVSGKEAINKLISGEPAVRLV